MWWKQSQPLLQTLKIEVRRFYWPEIQQVSAQVARTVDWTITLSGESIYVATQDAQFEINWQILQ